MLVTCFHFCNPRWHYDDKKDETSWDDHHVVEITWRSYLLFSSSLFSIIRLSKRAIFTPPMAFLNSFSMHNDKCAALFHGFWIKLTDLQWKAAIPQNLLTQKKSQCYCPISVYGPVIRFTLRGVLLHQTFHLLLHQTSYLLLHQMLFLTLQPVSANLIIYNFISHFKHQMIDYNLSGILDCCNRMN